jgi:sporulation protein YlmC with PRC-barrel domain
MSETIQFVIGTPVACSDGECGELKRVVIDPVAKALTHLVVEPRNRNAFGHLVPIELVESTTDEIHLRCTSSDFQALEEAEETQLLPGANGQYGYGQGQMLSFPYFGLGGMGMGMGGMGMGGMGMGGLGMGGMGMRGTGMQSAPQAVTYDKVPLGEVEVRRGAHVHATDGSIGRVQGLVIDPTDHHVTHVLLDEGHLWGKKEVAIPISAVTRADQGIQLSLTKNEIRDLPSVEIDHGE